MKNKEAMTAFFFLVVFLAGLVAGGCTDTFLVNSGDKHYFFGSNGKEMHKMLCDSGELKSVLADTKLPLKTKDDLYSYNCVVAGPSKEKIAEIYGSMTPEQRRDLRFAFQLHGFEINYVQC